MGHMFLARYNAVTWMNAEEGRGRGGEGRCLSSLVFIITIFSSQEIHDSQRHLVLE